MPFPAYGNPSLATYSLPIEDVYSMINVLPDNTGNEISARNVRDVVTGLWENMMLIQGSVSAVLGSASFDYTNSNPTTVAVGGVVTQSSFSNVSFTDLFDRIFYPYTPPVFGISVFPSTLELGNTTATVVLSWFINSTKNSVVNAIMIRPSSNVNVNPGLAPFTSVSNFLSGNTVLPNLPTTFTFSVNDIDVSVIPNTGTIHQTSVTVNWNLRRFWGVLSSSSPLTSVSTSPFSSSDISSLSSDLLSGYTQSRNILTNNDYVVFVWPSNSVDLTTFPPVMSVNGLPNNDWTKTRSGVVFTNQFGYTASYDVWRFNSIQPSYTLNYTLL
jgi:hypothetical protein